MRYYLLQHHVLRVWIFIFIVVWASTVSKLNRIYSRTIENTFGRSYRTRLYYSIIPSGSQSAAKVNRDGRKWNYPPVERVKEDPMWVIQMAMGFPSVKIVGWLMCPHLSCDLFHFPPLISSGLFCIRSDTERSVLTDFWIRKFKYIKWKIYKCMCKINNVTPSSVTSELFCY